MTNDGKKLITDIVNGHVMLEIPYYQRAYVWDEEQWVRFVNDMEDLSSGESSRYFMGALILKEKNGCPVKTQILVDGQQRLTTLFIYMKVVSLLANNDLLFDDDFRIALKHGEKKTQVALRHNRFDRKAFEQIVELKQGDNLDLALDGNGNVLKRGEVPQLSRLYEFLRKEIKLDKIDTDRIMRGVWFVSIDVSEEEDEQQIFDAINSLGVKLTTAELLKNYFFDENNYEDYRRLWCPVFEDKIDGVNLKRYWDLEITSGGSKNQLSNLFFAAYLNILIHESRFSVSAEDKLLFRKWDRLFASYKEFVDNIYPNGKLNFVKEVKDAAKLFFECMRPEVKEQDFAVDSVFDRISLMIFGMVFSVILPYVLRVFMKVEDRSEQEKIFSLLEAYLMRRLICGSETRGYYKLFYDTLLSDKYMTVDGLKLFLHSKSGGADSVSPSDKDVEIAVQSRIRTNKQNLAILYMLECVRGSSSMDGTGLRRFVNYTLEHLMPRDWNANWPLVGDEMAVEKRVRLVQTLGNMAIIPGKLNSRVGNANWEIKKNGKDGKPGLMEYANGLRTIKDWLLCPEWNEEMIQKRGEVLSSWINEAWPNV